MAITLTIINERLRISTNHNDTYIPLYSRFKIDKTLNTILFYDDTNYIEREVSTVKVNISDITSISPNYVGETYTYDLVKEWLEGNFTEQQQTYNPPIFGTPPNYTTFEEDGTIVMNGDATVYNDVVIPLLPKTTGAGNPTLTNLVGNIQQFTFAVNDSIQCENAEAPHPWKQGSGIEIHVHWANQALEATDRYVKWELEYSFANVKINSNTNTIFESNTPISVEVMIPANTPARTSLYSTLAVFTSGQLAAYKIGCNLILRLKRIAAVGAAPSANPFVFNLGIHYESDTLGSRTTIGK